MAKYVGNGAANTYTGGAANDEIAGNGGNDRLSGRGGDDTITGGAGNDRISGGAGVDTAVYASSIDDLVVTTDDQGIWTVTSLTEGSDTLTEVEQLRGADGRRILLVGEGGYETVQSAINAATNGDIIVVSGGLFDEDLVIDKAVTIQGKQAGQIASGSRDAAEGAEETTLLGRHQITAAGAVTVDGVRFLNDSTTTGGGPSGPTLLIRSSFDHTVANSIFYSAVAGGANGVDDRAVMLTPLSEGDITVTGNWFTGASQGAFSTASWGRAVWFDGGGADLTISGNTIEFSRSGLNLDMTGDSTADISGNTFNTIGSGVSVGVDFEGVTVSDNDVQNVGTDFNFRNLTTAITFDAETAIDAVTASTPASPSTDAVVVWAGGGDDTLLGSSGADVLVGNALNATATDADRLEGRGGDDGLSGAGGADTLLGGEGTDTLDGGAGDDILDGGAGVDTLTGGSGVDTARYAAGAVVARNASGAWTVTDAGGTDTLAGVERLQLGDDVFLLVDKTTTGGFATVQSAINAATGGETILIAPGAYDEDGRVDTSDIYKSGLEINKNDITLQGVDATGVYITELDDVAATIRSTYSAADNTTTRLTGTGVTINGLGFDAPATVPGVNNGGTATRTLVSVFADDATITNSAFTGAASYSVELIGESIDNYTIDSNRFGASLWVLNGAGDGVGDDERITNNNFVGTSASGQVSGILVLGRRVASDDPAADFAPINPSLPTTVRGNTFTDALPAPLYIRTDQAADPNGLATVEDFEAFIDGNLSAAGDTYAYVIDDATGELRQAPVGNDADAILATSLSLLTQLQTSGLVIGAGAAPAYRDTITSGDTVVVKTDGSETDVTLYDNNLRIDARLGSGGLNLTLAEAAFAGGAAGFTSAVTTVTVLDFGVDQGAQVDVFGNGLANTITGNSARNRLEGAGGADTLNGAGGSDLLDGGAGDDIMNGGEGADFLYGSDGADAMNGGEGVDTADYSLGAAVTIFRSTGQAFGAAAGDTYNSVEQFRMSEFADGYVGGDGTDMVFGAGGADDLDGRAGNDILRGQEGDDSLRGGFGADILDGGDGSDRIDGGDGVDRASYFYSSAGVNVSLLTTGAQNTGSAGIDTLVSIENLFGSTFNDVLRGSAGANTLNGDDGDDVLRGGDGADVLIGGAGVDTFVFALLTDSDGTGLDRISDMEAIDVIDLSGIDANGAGAGNGTFSRLGNDGAFTAAGQLRLVRSGEDTRLELNTDGDAAAEAVIILAGDFTAATAEDGWLL